VTSVFCRAIEQTLSISCAAPSVCLGARASPHARGSLQLGTRLWGRIEDDWHPSGCPTGQVRIPSDSDTQRWLVATRLGSTYDAKH